MFKQIQKKLLLLLCALVFLSSCVSMFPSTAVWKEKTYQPQKSGVIFYDNPPFIVFGGGAEILKNRRTDAESKMKTFCAPKEVQIISEHNREEITGYQTLYNSTEDQPMSLYSQSRKTGNNSHFNKNVFIQSTKFQNSQKTEQPIARQRVYIRFVCE